MNEIVYKFILAGSKVMPEMHLKQPGFTYSTCGPFTKKKERLTIYLSKRTRRNLFLTSHGLWRF